MTVPGVPVSPPEQVLFNHGTATNQAVTHVVQDSIAAVGRGALGH